MNRKHVTILLLPIFFNFTVGCTSTSTVLTNMSNYDTSDPEVLQELSSGKITRLERTDSVTIVFNEEGTRYQHRYPGKDSVIVGWDTTGNVSVTELRQVRTLVVEQSETSAGKTIALVGGIVAGTVLAFGIIMAVAIHDIFD